MEITENTTKVDISKIRNTLIYYLGKHFFVIIIM